jgi:hypothetical protein
MAFCLVSISIFVQLFSAIERKMEACAPNPRKVVLVGQGALLGIGVLRETGKAVIETGAGSLGDAYAAVTGQTIMGDEANRRVSAARALLPIIPGGVKKAAEKAIVKAAKAAKGAKFKPLAKVATTGAESAVNGLNLGKSFASEAQLGEIGTIVAGQGSSHPFRDAARIAKAHGVMPRIGFRNLALHFQPKMDLK